MPFPPLQLINSDISISMGIELNQTSPAGKIPCFPLLMSSRNLSRTPFEHTSMIAEEDKCLTTQFEVEDAESLLGGLATSLEGSRVGEGAPSRVGTPSPVPTDWGLYRCPSTPKARWPQSNHIAQGVKGRRGKPTVESGAPPSALDPSGEVVGLGPPCLGGSRTGGEPLVGSGATPPPSGFPK
ncbi:hypothetical protein CRG98_019561 [Punica granatum]|uniref:Uncharacterized protein n=1 Tax=Punica granatum TaxID=22663 RepID=A0A2I0JX81_PUNGR|nr:hypothetical protein CRG98_019561 [Punica granatum]